MRAFAYLSQGQAGWIEKEIPKPTGVDGVIRPLLVAPCTSDVHNVAINCLAPHRILGHEGLGEIVAVGEGVKDFQVGEVVVVPPVTPDWRTVPSQLGAHQHCSGLITGQKLSNSEDGLMAEYALIRDLDANAARIPPGVSWEGAVMAADMLNTGLYGAQLADVQPGDTVVVMGVGPVGLMAVAGAALRGASRLFAVGSRPVCVEAAKAYGATDIINYREGDIVQQILDQTHGKGVDRVILAGGDNDTFRQAVEMVKPGGCIGNVNYLGSGDYVRIPRVEWGCGMGHKTIRGGLMPGGRLRMEKLASLMETGRLDTSRLLTHRFQGFAHMEEALLLMKDKPRDLIKPVVIL